MMDMHAHAHDPTAGHTRHATELGAIREALALKGIDPDNLRDEE